MSTPPAEPSTAFGKYRILDRVAVGGMAEIYKARLDGIGGFHRTFAIKRILPHLSSRSEFVDMLVDEAKVAGLLSHANIVQIMDLGQVDGTYYIAMEYVDGPDLGRILQRCREKGITLPVPHAVFACIEALKGLEYAHNRQVMRGGRLVPLSIIHRDITPANVLVSFQGEIKLTDFGIAKASVKALETISGIVKGRFDYFSPEQAAGAQLDQRSDLFAMGVVLYEMLVGRHPFRRKGEADTIDAIREGAYTPPSQLNPDIPYQLEVVLDQALRVDPNDRYQSATAMKESLDRFFHDAGFIFSHSTLAAFLKGLFPSEARGSRQSAASPAAKPVPRNDADLETRPLRRDDLEDFPTAIERLPAVPDPGALNTDEQQLQAARQKAPPAPDAQASGRFGPLAGTGEESTLIKPNPLLAQNQWSSEAETVIKPDPTKSGGAHLRGESPPEATNPSARPPPATPRTSSRRTPNPYKRAQRSFRRFQIAYLAFGFVVTVGVLFVGFILGNQAANLTAEAGLDPTAALKHKPELVIEVPVDLDATVTVDGNEVPGPFPQRVFLDSGSSHLVGFSAQGYRPIETRLRLEQNDKRILSFQVESLTPSKKKDE